MVTGSHDSTIKFWDLVAGDSSCPQENSSVFHFFFCRMTLVLQEKLLAR